MHFLIFSDFFIFLEIGTNAVRELCNLILICVIFPQKTSSQLKMQVKVKSFQQKMKIICYVLILTNNLKFKLISQTKKENYVIPLLKDLCAKYQEIFCNSAKMISKKCFI